ncbi:hypothetical protein D2V17_04260, partial [Aurantiacibacter xanthus]
EQQRAALAGESDPEAELAAAKARAEEAGKALGERREALTAAQARKDDLAKARDEVASALSSARAELAGVEREWQALKRDR